VSATDHEAAGVASAPTNGTKRWRRYVAMGDSFTEGVGDERSDGTPRGWADLVAPLLADEYANLAIRGKLLGPILDDQLDVLLDLQPDLVTFAGGGNDVLRPRADMAMLRRLFDLAVARMVDSGATVVVFAGADPSDNIPLGSVVRAHGDRYSAIMHEIADRRGAVLVDLWSIHELRDIRYWSADHLHLNPAGHARVAAEVARTLGVVPPAGWSNPVAAVPPSERPVRDQVAYYREHVGPWVQRRLTGRSSGDRRRPKLPVPVNARDLD
jgi:lysophospholipase L1-like esterase